MWSRTYTGGEGTYGQWIDGSAPSAFKRRSLVLGLHDDGSFRTSGRQAERAVALSDITNPDALAYAQHRLDRLGVPKALVRAGARAGDVVRIGTFAFDFEPDDQPA